MKEQADVINKSKIWVHNSGYLLEIYVGKRFVTDVSTTLCDIDYAIDVLETLGYDVIDDDYEMRPITKDEKRATFQMKKEIVEAIGNIGYMKGDIDIIDPGFFYKDWYGLSEESNNQSFKDTFNEIIKSLRSDGNMLESKGALAHFCYKENPYKFKDRNEYGVRVDSGDYSFLMRLNPNKGERDLFCNCFEKEKLDKYLERKALNKEKER